MTIMAIMEEIRMLYFISISIIRPAVGVQAIQEAGVSSIRLAYARIIIKLDVTP